MPPPATVGSSGDVPAGASTPAATAPSPEMSPEAKLGFIVDLMSDVDLIRSSLDPLFDSVIWPRAHVAAGGDSAPFRACLDAACAKMKSKLEPFVAFIIGSRLSWII